MNIENTCTNAVSEWPLQNLSMPNLFRQACGIDAVNNSQIFLYGIVL